MNPATMPVEMTSTTSDLLLLFLGVIGILLALTTLGEVLRARQDAASNNPVLETYMILFLFASFAALREFLTLTAKRQADHNALALAFFVVLPLQYLFVGIGWQAMFTVFIPVYAFLLLPAHRVSATWRCEPLFDPGRRNPMGVDDQRLLSQPCACIAGLVL